MYDVVLWGTGGGYNHFVSLHGLDMVNAIAIVDGQGSCYKKIDGIPVIAPNDLATKLIEYDYLIVTVIEEKTYKEIIEDALKVGVPREKILPLRIFEISYFNFDEYVKIKESNVSILSDYCFAGHLYHKFGMKFTSPTINMFTDNENYYRFLCNLEKYMSTKMSKVENEVDTLWQERYACPRGRLDDVEWVFLHDLVYDTAADRWNQGIERFNWDNYIVIMSIMSDDMAYKFDALPIKNKIGFYWKNLKLDSVIYTPAWKNPLIRKAYGFTFPVFVNRIADEKNGIKGINWMKALLHHDGFNRIE